MKEKDEAIELVHHFNLNLGIRDYKKAKNCAIYLTHRLIQESFELKRISHLKKVITEIEKL